MIDLSKESDLITQVVDLEVEVESLRRQVADLTESRAQIAREASVLRHPSRANTVTAENSLRRWQAHHEQLADRTSNITLRALALLIADAFRLAYEGRSPLDEVISRGS